MEQNYLDRDPKFCPVLTLNLDCDLDNFNPDIRWIAISGPSNND